MTMRFFATPQDAEAAFYEALERADLAAMMAVWAEDEEVLCVHPGGERLAGFAAVRENWRRLFAGSTRVSVRTSNPLRREGMLLAHHSNHEHYSVGGEAQPRPPVVASHVFVRGAQGWHLFARHASASPAPLAIDIPAVLH